MVLVLIFFLSLYVFLLVSGDYEKQTDEEVKDDNDDKCQFTYSEAMQKIDDVFSLLPVSTRKTFTAC